MADLAVPFAPTEDVLNSARAAVDLGLCAECFGRLFGRLGRGLTNPERAERLGPGWFTVEQQAYADAGDGGRIARLDLLCTGYRAEGDHD